MNRYRRGVRCAAGLLLVLALLTTQHSASADGTFRFLTETLPDGTTNGEYVATLLTANAAGPITFGTGPGGMPPGLSIDAQSGAITGIPMEVNRFDVEFTANDGVETISLTVGLKVNSAGGGGNSGASFANRDLPVGRIGEVYAADLGIDNGVGPYLFGSSGLPAGLTLNGLTGEIRGTPAAAGTFIVQFSITDHGENDNKVVTALPLTVLPVGSDFVFETTMLDNGEVGTAYEDQWRVSGETGSVSWYATGLPPGLTVERTTGIVTGTPTVAGTYDVNLTAEDSTGPITTNLRMWIVPSASSNFYWDSFGIPPAIYNVKYDRSPPILVAAKGGTNVTYSVVGLPEGLTYDPLSGEIRGTSLDVGVYPVTFTAHDEPSGEELRLSMDFAVLPASGGEARDIAANLWIWKQILKAGDPGREKIKATFLYNADRRAGKAFDPTVDTLEVSVGSRVLRVDPGQFAVKSSGTMVAKIEEETGAKYMVKVIPKKQVVLVGTVNDTTGATVPGLLRSSVILGGRGFRIDEFLGDTGKFLNTSGYRSTCFVCADGKLKVKGPGSDAATMKLMLADPGLIWTDGAEFRVRLLSGDTVLVDKEFGALLTVTESAEAGTGRTIRQFKRTVADEAEQVILKKMKYDTGKGQMTLALTALDLSGMPETEAHLGVEVVIGPKTYFTTVTLFKRGATSWKTK